MSFRIQTPCSNQICAFPQIFGECNTCEQQTLSVPITIDKNTDLLLIKKDVPVCKHNALNSGRIPLKKGSNSANLSVPDTEGIFEYIGNPGYIQIKTKIHYTQPPGQTMPYEASTLSIYINGNERFRRVYGLDMQKRIYDDFLIDIENGDKIEFILTDLQFSEYVTINKDSFVIIDQL